MIILPYSDGDFDGVVALWRETGIYKPYNEPKSEIARIGKNNNCLLYIGREEDRVVASVLVGHDGYRGWIYKLAVAEDRRGKGYGRKLVQFAEAWLETAPRLLPEAEGVRRRVASVTLPATYEGSRRSDESSADEPVYDGFVELAWGGMEEFERDWEAGHEDAVKVLAQIAAMGQSHGYLASQYRVIWP